MTSSALGARLKPLPESPEGELALQKLRDAARRRNGEAVVEEVLTEPRTAAFLAAAFGDSPFLLDLAGADPARLRDILAEDPQERTSRVIGELASAAFEDRAEAMRGLRRARADVALTLGLADIGRVVGLEEVTACLTRFADTALQAALRFALRDPERRGKWNGSPEEGGLFVFAMGKQGADELNYSSDIDLIALYEPDAPGLAEDVEPSVFWVRIVREIVALLQERTADGYVLRVDLRLRPDPGATAVAISAPAALSYYESMGQNWERAALIKARACAGNIAAGEAFLKEIRPFIWRKYLDFAAIADIHSIKRQVHAHRGHGEVRVLGHDIKRGRGGIREIEFFTQTQQLIAGGRDPDLRGRRTRDMLSELCERGWITEDARKEMDEAYCFLRMVEHRLQIVRDEQTHTMPADREGLTRIARLCGESDADAFQARLAETMRGVARRYSELFEDAPELAGEAGNLVFTGGDDDPSTLETLASMGYADPKGVTEAVRAWHFGRFPATRSTRAREQLTELTPALLARLARGGNPDAALRAFDRLLRALPAGAQFFALLSNNRDLLDMLATILGCAPKLAEMFARRPHVVDALVDPALMEDWDDVEEWQRRLDALLRDARRFEDVLDRVRIFAAEQRFLISIQLLTGSVSPTRVGRAYSDLAELVVAKLFAATREEFEAQHGRVAGMRSVVVALGRLGTREMTAGSDLDLIVLYDHAEDAKESDGPRAVGPSQYFSRFTQRLISAISAPTAEGVAYEVDMRLRPSGRAGPLATRVDAFRHYQLEEAWVWEHMAISRARIVAGDEDLAAEVEETIEAAMAKPREAGALAGDVRDMRARIEKAKAPSGPFDVKLAPGGLVDCEFVAQYLVLSGLPRRAGETTIETIARGGETDRLSREDAELFVASATLQTALLQVMRAADAGAFDAATAPEGLREQLARVAERTERTGDPGDTLPVEIGPDSFSRLEKDLVRRQAETRAAFDRILGSGKEAAAAE